MEFDMSRPTVKGRRLAAANSKWQVYFDHLADARGNEVRDYLVIESPHPRADRITGIGVLPLLDGQFALINCHRHAVGSDLWESPRGFIDPGESPAEAALRELTEETGLVCSPDDLIPLGFYAPEPSTLAARGALFAARRCRGQLRPPADEIGLGALRLFDAGEMAELAARGGIEDAGTLVAYYRYCALSARPEVR
jgi:8-oxo-dGTP pyrophosphatase MutT (NUDIX family)